MTAAATTIALAGNPNSGKTTLFNALTGLHQSVGNWPGVTVEKKEGHLKDQKSVIVVDLPGIYSLSPYTLEEVITRNYLIEERPDVILNIVDGTSLVRNLYLTTQLVELGIPVVLAVNMMDLLEKRGITVDTERLGLALGCKVVEISALKGTGIREAADLANQAARLAPPIPQHSFSGVVEHALAHIEEAVLHDMPEEQQRWFAIKLFERDQMVVEKLGFSPERIAHIEQDIVRCEERLDDDSEGIIASERYKYIESILADCCTIQHSDTLSTTEKIDRIVTNRFAAFPIFALIMFLVYFIAVSTVGTMVTDWANDGVFGSGWFVAGAGAEQYATASEAFQAGRLLNEPNPADYGPWIPGVPVVLEELLSSINTIDWLQSLILDGIVAGVGAVIGFLPQMLVLFFLLAFLEKCGYMARIAFILDRVFRRFGLSGKSFIPILIGTGCGVPGIMASRTIESERDRRMTVMTTTFIPCSAKLPVIALIAGALFGGAWWIAPSAYFIGIAAILISGVILKKTRFFSDNVAPFVMELPSYHFPTLRMLLLSMWENGWAFIKRAGTLILLGTIIIWFAASYGWSEDGSFGAVGMSESILATIGSAVSGLFAPLGWGDWKSVVATISGLFAKENLVSTFGILYNFAESAEGGATVWGQVAASYTALSAYSFLVFNLLCAPCIAAMAAIRREMNSVKWFWIAIGYQCGFAYAVSLCIYQFGMLFTAGAFGFGTVAALIVLAGFLYLLFRPHKKRAV